jgi:uncharacterized membrane protein SpoIIM required for sporulation
MGCHDHPITFIIALISAGACGLGVAVEIIRVVQEIQNLQLNPQATMDVQFARSGCGYIPTTDIPVRETDSTILD